MLARAGEAETARGQATAKMVQDISVWEEPTWPGNNKPH